MSIDRCEGCNAQIDTDMDSECYVEIGNMRAMTWMECLCARCREERAEMESERETLASRAECRMEDMQ